MTAAAYVGAIAAMGLATLAASLAAAPATPLAAVTA